MSWRVNRREGSEVRVEREMYDTLLAIAKAKYGLMRSEVKNLQRNRDLAVIGQRIKEALGYGKVNANSTDQIRRRIAIERGLTFENKSMNNPMTEAIVWNSIPNFRDINPFITPKTQLFFDEWNTDLMRREVARNPVEENEDEDCKKTGLCSVMGGRRRTRKTKKTKGSKRSKSTRGRR